MELLGTLTIIGYILSTLSIKYVLIEEEYNFYKKISFDVIFFLSLILFSIYAYSLISDVYQKFNFITSLYHIKIVNRKTLGFYIDYLFNKLQNSTGEDSEKYTECLCKFLTKINDKKIFTEKLVVLKELQNEKDRISSRYRFMIMDLLDLYKKM